MDPNANDVAHDFSPFFRIFKNGSIHRLLPSDPIPPSNDPRTGVSSKDVSISPDVSARLFIPQLPDTTRKLPLIIYIHGGAFCIGSAFSPLYHIHVSNLAAEANAVALSVQYRLAPEHQLPAAYDDAWAAFQWGVGHSGGGGPESWLNDHVDFQRIFLAGDSAGANIAYNVANQVGSGNGTKGFKIIGMILAHPFFMNDKPDKLIEFVFPSSKGLDDPRLNPKANPNLSSLGCTRVIVFVAGRDKLKDRGVALGEALRGSGWGGSVEVVETPDEDHVFHLFKPKSEKALDLVNRVISFINQS